MENDFLSALHEDDLINGNLRPHKRAPWSDENAWTSLGYIARIHKHHCTCGNTETQLLGVFHRERTPSGTLREQRLARGWQIPLDRPYPIQITTTAVLECSACITSKGFSHDTPL